MSRNHNVYNEDSVYDKLEYPSVDVGDTISYIPDNQMGYKQYKVVNNLGKKSLNLLEIWKDRMVQHIMLNQNIIWAGNEEHASVSIHHARINRARINRANISAVHIKISAVQANVVKIKTSAIYISAIRKHLQKYNLLTIFLI